MREIEREEKRRERERRGRGPIELIRRKKLKGLEGKAVKRKRIEITILGDFKIILQLMFW